MKIRIKMPGENETELDKKVRKSKDALDKSYATTTVDLWDLVSALGPILILIGMFGFHWFLIKSIFGYSGPGTIGIAGVMTFIMWSFVNNFYRVSTAGL